MEQQQPIRISTPKPGMGPKLKDEPPPPPLEPQQAKDRSTFIRNNITIVETLYKNGKSFEQMKEAAPEFAENYPHLFIMVATKEGYNKETLETMLRMMDNMGDAKVSQHDASIKVGTHLMKTFMKKS